VAKRLSGSFGFLQDPPIEMQKTALSPIIFVAHDATSSDALISERAGAVKERGRKMRPLPSFQRAVIRAPAASPTRCCIVNGSATI
jgi:hypothetical protein